MKNLVLKQNDLVRIVRLNSEFRRLGLSIGQVLPVVPAIGLVLGLETSLGATALTDLDGQLTDSTRDLTLVQCPLTLPRGA